eukprot:SM000010S04269  [mRNA]  locus=s10:606288:608592:+ [translate_table: standard]
MHVLHWGIFELASLSIPCAPRAVSRRHLVSDARARRPRRRRRRPPRRRLPAARSLVGLGPALALAALVLLPKPVLTLAALCSTFYWLVTIIATAGLTRLLLPSAPPTWFLALLLLVAVACQEHLLRALQLIARRQSKAPLSFSDKVQIYLGFGHGLAHSLLFFLSLMTPAMGPATYYVSACPQMPIFLAMAIASSAFFIIHALSMIMAFDGYGENSSHQYYAPIIHFAAASTTLLNLAPSGCLVGLPLLWIIVVSAVSACHSILWRKSNTVQQSVVHRAGQSSTLHTRQAD